MVEHLATMVLATLHQSVSARVGQLLETVLLPLEFAASSACRAGAAPVRTTPTPSSPPTPSARMPTPVHTLYAN